METRHREEEENLVHCLVSSGGGWTQGFLSAVPDRGAPPPVNSPLESSQYIVCMHKCTCTVTCCNVPLCVLFAINIVWALELLSVFIAGELFADCAIQQKMEAGLDCRICICSNGNWLHVKW